MQGLQGYRISLEGKRARIGFAVCRGRPFGTTIPRLPYMYMCMDVYDDVTDVYDDVTYVYDDVTYPRLP